MIELDTTFNCAKIRVFGAGGGGGNAVNNMIEQGLQGVEFIVANTDNQALEKCLAKTKVQLGKAGLGAGANPDVGRQSVEESAEEIKDLLKGTDMLFVTCGMGGGTGTGGAPVIARIGQEIDALVVAIVTRPFKFEGIKKSQLAEAGIAELRQYVDALIVISNQKLLDVCEKETPLRDAFRIVDKILYNATKGIAEIISVHGLVNVDFADVRTIMKGMGDALIGIGSSNGKNRASEATYNALNSPLLEGIKVSGSKGVLVNVTGGSDMTMHEVDEIVSIVLNATGESVNLIHGVVSNPEPSDEIQVTVVATGFNHKDGTSIENDTIKQNNLGQIQLPIKSTNNSEYIPSPSIKRTKAPFPFTNLDKEASPPVRIIQTPKGSAQLEKYNDPAYKRRIEDGNSSELKDDSDKIESLVNRRNNLNNGSPIKDDKIYTVPTFRRKTMD